jgi:hypothetical protein
MYYCYVATLVAYHGRVDDRLGIRYIRALGIVAVDIGGPYAHFIDCYKEGTTSIPPLVWRFRGRKTEFPASNEEVDMDTATIYVRRLNLNPFRGLQIGLIDLGTYTCQDTTDGETLSLILVQGNCKTACFPIPFN